MQDTESARTGYTKLYHPRGPLVSLPVVGDTPKAMFDYVTAMLDAGFVVAAPGLEVGEEKEMISGVLRGTIEHDGDESPTLLLYAANEGMEFSVLRIYLDTHEDIKSFETACGVKLDALPVYDGKDKPKRDGGKVAQKYIHRLPKPVPVIFKQNTKWSQEEADKAAASQTVYNKAKRVFVRWADAPTGPPGDGTPPLTDMQVAESAWKVRLGNVGTVDDLNKCLPMIKAITDPEVAKRAWNMCLEFATGKKWVFDKTASVFKDAAEVAATPLPTQPAKPVAPTAAAAAPPPPDEPDVHPLIAEWVKRLDPETVNLAKMNGEVLTEFKKIIKQNPLRAEIWAMIEEFGNKHGCPFDRSLMKFVDSMP